MKIIIALLVLVPSLSYAVCPIAINVNGQEYCTEVQWQKGERQIRGKSQISEQYSPHMIVRSLGQTPLLWVYSGARFQFWKKEDTRQQPQFIENLIIFPFMRMKNGHHHSTASDFYWDEPSAAYEVKGIAFYEMDGCWSLRWTLGDPNDIEHSGLLLNVFTFKNLSDEQNQLVAKFCQE